eukprot:TRINITY_DN55090_c0_g1_i1.p2 TRINITY_DN55090_c0_g1~~TRINITY_DN55090_c0_g1_i1.p2  ORF type:complete len:487 (+),score=92.61 TRINITY_DN55090_c0_g1_i1:89-1462(+)
MAAGSAAFGTGTRRVPGAARSAAAGAPYDPNNLPEPKPVRRARRNVPGSPRALHKDPGGRGPSPPWDPSVGVHGHGAAVEAPRPAKKYVSKTGPCPFGVEPTPVHLPPKDEPGHNPRSAPPPCDLPRPPAHPGTVAAHGERAANLQHSRGGGAAVLGCEVPLTVKELKQLEFGAPQARRVRRHVIDSPALRSEETQRVCVSPNRRARSPVPDVPERRLALRRHFHDGTTAGDSGLFSPKGATGPTLADYGLPHRGRSPARRRSCSVGDIGSVPRGTDGDGGASRRAGRKPVDNVDTQRAWGTGHAAAPFDASHRDAQPAMPEGSDPKWKVEHMSRKGGVRDGPQPSLSGPMVHTDQKMEGASPRRLLAPQGGMAEAGLGWRPVEASAPGGARADRALQRTSSKMSGGGLLFGERSWSPQRAGRRSHSARAPDSLSGSGAQCAEHVVDHNPFRERQRR